MKRKRFVKKSFVPMLFFCSICFSVLLLFLLHSISSATSGTEPLWPIESIDTMKYSRDAARDQHVLSQVPLYMDNIVAMGANYVAIDTPYDKAFYPVLKRWVDEARLHHLHVWFRGNIASWEGWFGYPLLKNPGDDHVLIKAFILSHPELFQNGDIFTPVPEPENGVIGDPRNSVEKADTFNTFLVDSYNNCMSSFSLINKKVLCGYFSMNGDVASQVVTESTVEHIGNVIVIDHYVSSPGDMGDKIDELHRKFPQAKIIIGEFGAPIPGINGDMSEIEQATFIDQVLQQIFQQKDIVGGVNYWTLGNGSTALITENGLLKPVAHTLTKYFKPNVAHIIVKTIFGTRIDTPQVKINDLVLTQQDNKTFLYKGIIPSYTLTITESGYKTIIKHISFSQTNTMNLSFVLEPEHKNLFDRFFLFLSSFFTR